MSDNMTVFTVGGDGELLSVTEAPVPIGCKVCGHLACVCELKAKHEPGCRFLFSATCAVPIECDHGRDVCPECDPCTCKSRRAP